MSRMSLCPLVALAWSVTTLFVISRTSLVNSSSPSGNMLLKTHRPEWWKRDGQAKSGAGFQTHSVHPYSIHAEYLAHLGEYGMSLHFSGSDSAERISTGRPIQLSSSLTHLLQRSIIYDSRTYPHRQYSKIVKAWQSPVRILETCGSSDDSRICEILKSCSSQNLGRWDLMETWSCGSSSWATLPASMKESEARTEAPMRRCLLAMHYGTNTDVLRGKRKNRSGGRLSRRSQSSRIQIDVQYMKTPYPVRPSNYLIT